MIIIDTPALGSLLLFAVLCILAINILVLAKFAFARLSADHLDEMENLSEEQKEFLKKLYERPDTFMNTATFLILFFIILMASYTGYQIDESVVYLQSAWNLGDTGLIYIGQVVALAIFASIVLAFGEIIPKGLGLSFPQKYISFMAPLVYYLGYIVWPFRYMAELIGNLFLKAQNAPYRTEIDLVHTEEEIRMLVSRSHQQGEIDQIEGELIDNVFDFVDRIAKEVMIPRQDVDCVYVEDSFEETMEFIKTTSHTRYPLCMEDKDHIIGLIHIKDIMDREEEARRDLRTIRRNILVVPEVMKLSVLLQYMRTRRIYQAVVVDEYGGMVGLVGLEDILEELVGDIQDEHERNLPAILKNANGTFSFAGQVLVDEVADILDIDLEEYDEDTIGGVVFGQLGRTPALRDRVELKGYAFVVVELQGYRISRVFVEKLEPTESEGTEE